MGITPQSGLQCGAQRSRSQNLPGERPDFTSSQAIVSPVQACRVSWNLYLDVYTARSLKTQAASLFQEEAVSRKVRIRQCIPQVLRDASRLISHSHDQSRSKS